ncbi:hypothetical protein H7I76_31965 [Mycolicibacterium vaccae]|nr:hypothetical protein [Mycolicibacterium vaccae]
MAADNPPGYYRHPFQHQTLLNSAQLATYLQLPQVETHGFAIKDMAGLDVVTAAPNVGDVTLGHVIERRIVTGHTYSFDPNRLNRHGFISGVTGSGKTIPCSRSSAKLLPVRFRFWWSSPPNRVPGVAQ